MAEALLRSMAGDRFEVFSAGTSPKGLHPMTIEVMRELDIDVSRHTSKDVKEFIGQSFDRVITVCDRAREQCPIFPGAESIHWEFDDPADVPPERQLQAFRNVRDEIRQRIRLFLIGTSRRAPDL